MSSEWCQSLPLQPNNLVKEDMAPTATTTKAGFLLCKPPKKRYLEDMNQPSNQHQLQKFSKSTEQAASPEELPEKPNGATSNEDQPLNLCMEKEKTITGSQGSLISRMVDKLFCDSNSKESLLDSFLQQMSAHSKPYPGPTSNGITQHHGLENDQLSKAASNSSGDMSPGKTSDHRHYFQQMHQEHSPGSIKHPSSIEDERNGIIRKKTPRRPLGNNPNSVVKGGKKSNGPTSESHDLQQQQQHHLLLSSAPSLKRTKEPFHLQADFGNSSSGSNINNDCNPRKVELYASSSKVKKNSGPDSRQSSPLLLHDLDGPYVSQGLVSSAVVKQGSSNCI